MDNDYSSFYLFCNSLARRKIQYKRKRNQSKSIFVETVKGPQKKESREPKSFENNLKAIFLI